MLDDLKYIHQKDAQDALGIVEKQGGQLQHDFSVVFKPQEQINNVVVAGMGGSALAASIIRSWPQLNVPFQVVRDYDIPSFVNKNTLFIASSYSGNTEETLFALNQAVKKGSMIAVITAGGELAKIAAEKEYPLYKIPEGIQPRMAVMYNLAALTQLLSTVKLIEDSKLAELQSAGKWVESQMEQWRPDVPTTNNQAKQIAQELAGKSVVVYSGPLLSPAGYKWKININENAKQVAWCNQFPEFNHNEFLGWTEQPVQKPYAVIDLRSNQENSRIQKRFEVTERLLSGRRPAPIIVQAEGDTILEQLLWTIGLGDFVSVYLAILNGLNPTPVDLIEKFKDLLTQ